MEYKFEINYICSDCGKKFVAYEGTIEAESERQASDLVFKKKLLKPHPYTYNGKYDFTEVFDVSDRRHMCPKTESNKFTVGICRFSSITFTAIESK